MSAGHHCCGQCARENKWARYSRLTGAIALVFVTLALPGCSGADDVLAETSENSATNRPQLRFALSPLELEARRMVEKGVRDRKAQEELRSKAGKAMQAVLFDPSSAQYVDVRAGRGGAICGKVNAKNRYGAYVGFKYFVVESDDGVEISSRSDGLDSERYGSFADAYLAGCATAAEKKEHEEYTSVVVNLTAENLIIEDNDDPFAE